MIDKCVDVQIMDYGYERFGTVVNVVPVQGRTDEQILDDITGLGSGIQIVLHAEVLFEKGKFEKEIISEIEKFAEGKAIELVVQLSIVSSLHKGRRLKTGREKNEGYTGINYRDNKENGRYVMVYTCTDL